MKYLDDMIEMALKLPDPIQMLFHAECVRIFLQVVNFVVLCVPLQPRRTDYYNLAMTLPVKR